MPFCSLLLIRDLELALGSCPGFRISDFKRYALCSMPFAISVNASVSFFSTSDILSSIPLIEYPGRTPSHLHLAKGHQGYWQRRSVHSRAQRRNSIFSRPSLHFAQPEGWLPFLH